MGCEKMARLEHENMIMRSALSDITHQREGCFLTQHGNLERDEDGKVTRMPTCVKKDDCIGCVFADIARNAYKDL